jgi:MFS family permease
VSSSPKDTTKGPTQQPKYTTEFRLFQLQYLGVYLTIMLADWLQGTNMYTLYSSYGVNVGTLFITGFLSSAIFGTFLGVLTDKWGRKTGCIIFCVLEIVINTIEHVPSMPALLIGIGGCHIITTMPSLTQ